MTKVFLDGSFRLSAPRLRIPRALSCGALSNGWFSCCCCVFRDRAAASREQRPCTLPILLCGVSRVTLQRTRWKVGGPVAAQGQPTACLEWTFWMEPCVSSGNKKNHLILEIENSQADIDPVSGWQTKRWWNQRINEDDGAISATVTWCCRVTLEPLWWLMAPVEPCCWRQEGF